jgi:hypothetical protein
LSSRVTDCRRGIVAGVAKSYLHEINSTRLQPAFDRTPRAQAASRTRHETSKGRRFIRRITDGAITENQAKARGAGDVRVALFPSKHSRVRIPSPALEANNKTIRPPMGGRMACRSLTRKERTLERKSRRSALDLFRANYLAFHVFKGRKSRS